MNFGGHKLSNHSTSFLIYQADDIPANSGKILPYNCTAIHKNKCKSFKYKQPLYPNLITKASNYPTSSNCFLFLIPLLYHCPLPYRQEVKQSQLHVSRAKCKAAIGYEKMTKEIPFKNHLWLYSVELRWTTLQYHAQRDLQHGGKGCLFGSIL